MLVHGQDSSAILRPLLLGADGSTIISASSLPLPVGASTETTQLLVKTAVQALAKALVSAATDTLRANIIAALPAGTNNIGDVDVLSSALPTGAATEATLLTRASQATLATLLTESDFDTRIALKATEATLLTLLTQSAFTSRIGEVAASPVANTLLARLKDILSLTVLAAGSNRVGKVTVRNSADSADIDPLAGGTFTGRVGEVQASPTANTLLARLKDILSLTVLAAGDNNIGNVDIVTAPTLKVQNQNGELFAGIGSVGRQRVSNLSAAAGTNALVTTAVPAGKVWKVTALAMVDIDSANTKRLGSAYDGANDYVFAYHAAPAADAWTLFNGEQWVVAGDVVRGLFFGCTLNDDLYLDVNYIQMTAP